MDLGKILEQLRIDNDFTQEYVANKIHVEQPTVSNYESGKAMPSYSVLMELANLYNVSLDYLFGRTRMKCPIREIEENMATAKGDFSLDKFFQLNREDRATLQSMLEALYENEQLRKSRK